MIKAHPSSNIRARIGPRSRTAEGPKCDWPSELIPASRVRIVVGIFLTQLMGIQWWWRWWSKIHFGMDHRYPQIFFPTLTCGVFVFSAVSAPPSSRLSSHSHTHTSHSSSITHTHIPITHTHTTHSHTSHSHIHRTHITFFTHPTHTSHIHTHTLTRTHIPHTRDLVHCKGVGSTPWRPSGVPHLHTHPTHTSHSHTHTSQSHTHTTHSHTYHPWSPPLCRCLLRGRRGTWCTAKGLDVRPGVPPVSFGLRRSAGGFCVAGVGLGALQRGRMYALASLRCPSVVPPVSLGLRRSAGGFCVAGSRMYALASLRITHTHIPITHTHTTHSHTHLTHTYITHTRQEWIIIWSGRNWTL